VRVGLKHEGSRTNVPSYIIYYSRIFTFYFLVFVIIVATDIHNLWKFQLSNFHGLWDIVWWQTDGRTDSEALVGLRFTVRNPKKYSIVKKSIKNTIQILQNKKYLKKYSIWKKVFEYFYSNALQHRVMA